jgi:hypothetical protein
MKRTTILSLLAMVLLSAMVFAGTDTHTTDLSLGNSAPTITNVDAIPAVDLVAGGTVPVYVVFDVTDINGYADIDLTQGEVVLSKSGEVSRTNTTGNCASSNDGANTVTFNCTVTMYFYDGAGSWNVNVSGRDDAAVLAYNDTTSVTVNALDDILFNDTAINCGSGLVAASNDNKCEVLQITNRGNQNYASMNETGYNLDDDTTGTYVIGAPQFSVSTTDTPVGTALSNGAEVAIPSTTLNKGASSTLNIYTYVDIPTGRPADTYTSTSDWIIEAIV